MSPQLLWTIAGLILTVLTLGGVAISTLNADESASAKLVAAEVGNIAVATKLWNIQKSTDGTFTGIFADGVGPLIPSLAVAGTAAASRLTSKASSGVSYGIAVGTPTNKVVITAAGLTAAEKLLAEAALAAKACVVATVNATSFTYTCNS
jgi:hypothetical protein